MGTTPTQRDGFAMAVMALGSLDAALANSDGQHLEKLRAWTEAAFIGRDAWRGERIRAYIDAEIKGRGP